MGTQNDFGGPTPRSQLLPDFLDEPPANAPDLVVLPDNEEPPDLGEPQAEPDPFRDGPRVRAPAVPQLDNARRAFTDYAGSRELAALRRSFSHYVRDGLGGTRTAASRMRRSSAAANALGLFLRDVQARGIERILQELRLEALVGRPTREVFAGVIDAICPNVESIDDALAREALLDTVLEFNDLGVADIADLDVHQMREFFQRFICNAILRRFLADVSARGNAKAASDFSYQTLDQDIRDFIGAAVEGRIGQELARGGPLDPAFTVTAIETIFEAAWAVLEAMERE